MRNPNTRPQSAPDPAESRERADPKKEAGLGKMTETSNTPVNKPEHHPKSDAQSEKRREITSDEVTDQSEAVSPTDRRAHGGRGEPSEAEATGKRSSTNER